MVLGDYGTGLPDAKSVAEKFNEIAESTNASFVIGTGDNFYPDGIDE